VILRALSLASIILLSPLSSLAQTAADKPKVPPGRDPGGFAIALFSTGVDYTDPAVANCLARDGEGELIG
jgi:hypothetical protein